jgi:hypothetical protein
MSVYEPSRPRVWMTRPGRDLKAADKRRRRRIEKRRLNGRWVRWPWNR